MRLIRSVGFIVAATLCAPGWAAADSLLAPCPDRPNCVSSLAAADQGCHIAPLAFSGPSDDAWRRLAALVGALPGVTVVQQTDAYLHAECRSALFGFVDDLELVLDPAASRIQVRSAARSGYWDLGVNRRRVETLRQRFTP